MSYWDYVCKDVKNLIMKEAGTHITMWMREALLPELRQVTGGIRAFLNKPYFEDYCQFEHCYIVRSGMYHKFFITHDNKQKSFFGWISRETVQRLWAGHHGLKQKHGAYRITFLENGLPQSSFGFNCFDPFRNCRTRYNN